MPIMGTRKKMDRNKAIPTVMAAFFLFNLCFMYRVVCREIDIRLRPRTVYSLAVLVV
jgi:hypothetical protein